MTEDDARKRIVLRRKFMHEIFGDRANDGASGRRVRALLPESGVAGPFEVETGHKEFHYNEGSRGAIIAHLSENIKICDELLSGLKENYPLADSALLESAER